VGLPNPVVGDHWKVGFPLQQEPLDNTLAVRVTQLPAQQIFWLAPASMAQSVWAFDLTLITIAAMIINN
jgi:hypothetical protein